jgi:hypothetical protein
VYSTCLFCHAPLGRNDAIEAFPVGKRLAWDAAKGRLWVVCRRCERWNLTPLEERWEAIEQCERAFRSTRLRVATDNIGLARLRGGLELVRIGRADRTELAAWRYGDQFGRRRRRALTSAGLGLGAIGALLLGGTPAGLGVGGVWMAWGGLTHRLLHGKPTSQLTTVPAELAIQGPGYLYPPRPVALLVRRKHLGSSTVGAGPEGLRLWLEYDGGRALLVGDVALQTTARLLPHANRGGASRGDVREAVSLLEAHDDARGFVASLAAPQESHWSRWRGFNFHIPLGESPAFGLDGVQRLALEMALHEESERRAMGGELARLEASWREAEEIAAIADALPDGDDLARRLAEMTGGRGH